MDFLKKFSMLATTKSFPNRFACNFGLQKGVYSVSTTEGSKIP